MPSIPFYNGVTQFCRINNFKGNLNFKYFDLANYEMLLLLLFFWGRIRNTNIYIFYLLSKRLLLPAILSRGNNKTIF